MPPLAPEDGLAQQVTQLTGTGTTMTPAFCPIVSVEDLPPPPKGKRGWPWTIASGDARPAQSAGNAVSIGIVTPSYNQGDYIEATIRSVLLQGHPRLEYYIEDGGSTDQTISVIEKYAPYVSGWVSEKDRGQSHAINKAMARLRESTWVTWLNSDDLLLPGALQEVSTWAATSAPDALALVGNAYHYIEKTGRRQVARRREDLDGTNVRNWLASAFLQPACFFSKKAFDEVGGVNESRYYAMDYELWVRLGERGRFELIDAFLAQDLHHDRAKTQIGMGKYYGEIVEVLYDLGHREDARELVANLFDELRYNSRITSALTDNAPYRRLLQPMVRRILGAPGHLQDKGAKKSS